MSDVKQDDDAALNDYLCFEIGNTPYHDSDPCQGAAFRHLRSTLSWACRLSMPTLLTPEQSDSVNSARRWLVPKTTTTSDRPGTIGPRECPDVACHRETASSETPIYRIDHGTTPLPKKVEWCSRPCGEAPPQLPLKPRKAIQLNGGTMNRTTFEIIDTPYFGSAPVPRFQQNTDI